MFVAATSCESTPDSSPSDFHVTFTENLKLKKSSELEFVSLSCKRQNNLTVNAFNNSVILRLGTDEEGDQHLVEIPTGVYTNEQLRDALQTALNNATIPAWANFAVSLQPSGSDFKFQIEHAASVAADRPPYNVFFFDTLRIRQRASQNFELRSVPIFMPGLTADHARTSYLGHESLNPLKDSLTLNVPTPAKNFSLTAPNDTACYFDCAVHPLFNSSVDNIIASTLGFRHANCWQDGTIENTRMKVEAGTGDPFFTQNVINGIFMERISDTQFTMHLPFDPNSTLNNLIHTTYDVNIDLSGVMRITNSAGESYYMFGNVDAFYTPTLRGRFESLESYSGTKTYLYVLDKGVVLGDVSGQHASPSFAGGQIKYILNSIGRFNYFNQTNQPSGTNTTRKAAKYKITGIDSNNNITSFIVIDAGEEYFVPNTTDNKILFDDPETMLQTSRRAVELNPSLVLTQAAAITNSTAISNQDNGLLMSYQDVIPFTQVGLCRRDLLPNISSTSMGDFVVQIEDNFTSSPSIKVSVLQYFEGDGLLKILETTSATWGSLTYSSGRTPPPNWTSFMYPNQVLVRFIVNDCFNVEIELAHSLPYQEAITLLRTGETVDGTTFQRTLKERNLPLFPTLSMIPFTLFRVPTVSINGNVEEPYTPPAIVGKIVTPDDVAFQTAAANNDKPRLMLKCKPLNDTQIVANPTLANEITFNDFEPNTARLGNILGMESCYFLDTNEATRILLAATNVPSNIPFMPAFTIELPTLPIKGIVGKSFDFNNSQIGTGVKNRILHITQAKEEVNNQGASQTFTYESQFRMPVKCENEADFQVTQLHVRLRNAATGETVQGLLHPTQLVFRVI